MTGSETGRRGLLVGAVYVVLCAGLAALVAAGIAPTAALAALLVLLFPAAIVPFGTAINLVFLAEGFPDGWVWPAAFVVFTAALAGLHVWLFRAMARNWRTAHAEMRRTPVTSGADPGP